MSRDEILNKNSKVFLKVDGWNEKRLFEYSKRHLVAARVIFENQDTEVYILSVFSGGYLCHLGIELLLKGCWLFEKGFFENEHDLHKLAKKIDFLNFNDKQKVYLSNIQLFNEMRYPQDLSNVKLVQDSDIDANLPEEIGDHDWIGTIELLHGIQNQMPIDLQQISKSVFACFKNILTEKKYLKKGKYLYRLVLNI